MGAPRIIRLATAATSALPTRVRHRVCLRSAHLVPVPRRRSNCAPPACAPEVSPQPAACRGYRACVRDAAPRTGVGLDVCRGVSTPSVGAAGGSDHSVELARSSGDDMGDGGLSTPDRAQVDPGPTTDSTPSRPKVDSDLTQNRPQIDPDTQTDPRLASPKSDPTRIRPRIDPRLFPPQPVPICTVPALYPMRALTPESSRRFPSLPRGTALHLRVARSWWFLAHPPASAVCLGTGRPRSASPAPRLDQIGRCWFLWRALAQDFREWVCRLLRWCLVRHHWLLR